MKNNLLGSFIQFKKIKSKIWDSISHIIYYTPRSFGLLLSPSISPKYVKCLETLYLLLFVKCNVTSFVKSIWRKN